MSDIEDILVLHKIILPSYAPGRYYVTCPHCSAGRKFHHQKLKVLGVTIEGNGPDAHVYWGCNHCKWTGPQRGARATFYDYGARTKVRGDNGKRFYWEGDGPAEALRGTLYRHQEVAAAAAEGQTICIAEGEKDVDTLWAHGFAATCNAHGAGQWTREHSLQLVGTNLVVLNDNDEAGYQHAADVVRHSAGVARSVRRLDLAAHWPAMPAGGDVSDWFAFGGGNDDWLDRLCAEAPQVNGHDEGGRATSDWIIPTVWDGVPLPVQEWSVRDLIPAHQVALFSGAGGAGKSTIGLHLAIAHVLGRSFLNYDPTPGPAMFIDAEDSLGTIHRRLNAVLEHYQASYRELAHLHILSLHGKNAVLASGSRTGVVTPTTLFDAIRREVEHIRPMQIVIASSADVFAGSEIDRTQVTQFIHLLTGLTIIGSVILIVHPAKLDPNGLGYSGSTAWFNAARAQINLRTTKDETSGTSDSGDLRLLEFKKNQYGPCAAALSLQWKNGMFLPVATGTSEFDKAARQQKGQFMFKDLTRRYRNSGFSVSPNKNAPNYAPRIFAQQPEAKAIHATEAELEEAMHRLLQEGHIKVVEYGPPSRSSKRIVFTDDGN